VAGLVAFEHRRWSGSQHFALTAGLLGVYVVGGLATSAILHGPADLPGHAAVVLVCLAALWAAWRQTRRQKRAAAASYQGISPPS